MVVELMILLDKMEKLVDLLVLLVDMVLVIQLRVQATHSLDLDRHFLHHQMGGEMTL